jgi:hypothetical protein
MIGSPAFNAYVKEQARKTAKHSGQWEQMELPFHPESLKHTKAKQFNPKDAAKKWDHEHSKLKKKPKEDLEAILKLEEELWNS